MRTIQHRLSAIEARLAPHAFPRWVYVVTGSERGQEPSAFVQAEGYEYDEEADLIINVVGIPSPGGGGACVTGPFGWVGHPPQGGSRSE
jgi:hypothetical protein